MFSFLWTVCQRQSRRPIKRRHRFHFWPVLIFNWQCLLVPLLLNWMKSSFLGIMTLCDPPHPHHSAALSQLLNPYTAKDQSLLITQSCQCLCISGSKRNEIQHREAASFWRVSVLLEAPHSRAGMGRVLFESRTVEIQSQNTAVLRLFREMGWQSGKQRDVLLSPATMPQRMSILPGQQNLLVWGFFQGWKKRDIANKIILWWEECFTAQNCCPEGMVWFINV